ncbi:MAG: universal stress protein [Thermodesulfobacteriota bacterium]
MIKNILVALDGSNNSAAAAEYALWLAGIFKAGVKGIFVADRVLLEGPFLYDLTSSMGLEPIVNFSDKMRETLGQKGELILSDFKARCMKAKVPADTILSSGVVAAEICTHARLADLVVMGRKGDNEAFDTGMLGSVTEGVIRKSPVPVFIAPGKFKPVKNPLLVYDGSDNAADAMRIAAELAKVTKSMLSVASVGAAGDADKHLVDAMDYLKSYDIKAVFKELKGEASLEIEKYYRESGHDMLFLGATHRSRVLEFVLGSTAEYVLRAVTGAILVVR